MVSPESIEPWWIQGLTRGHLSSDAWRGCFQWRMNYNDVRSVPVGGRAGPVMVSPYRWISLKKKSQTRTIFWISLKNTMFSTTIFWSKSAQNLLSCSAHDLHSPKHWREALLLANRFQWTQFVFISYKPRLPVAIIRWRPWPGNQCQSPGFNHPAKMSLLFEKL